MIELEEVVELADAVAASNGIASGMGTFGYGFRSSWRQTTPIVPWSWRWRCSPRPWRGPVSSWPVVSVETIAEDEDMFYDMVEE